MKEQTEPKLDISTVLREGEGKVLAVNGRVLDDSHAYESPDGKLHGVLYSEADSELVAHSKLLDIQRFFATLRLSVDYGWNPLITGVEILFEEWRGGEPLSIRFRFDTDFEEWKNPYSLAEYSRALAAAAINDHAELFYYQEDHDFLGNGFGLECEIRSVQNRMKEEVEYWAEKVRLISSTTTELVFRNVKKDSLVTFFDFPSAVRPACEQYLVYFAQFLRDLGIEAKSEIKEEAGRVLFSVTPKEGRDALSQIKEALNVYLDLPRNPEFNEVAKDYSDIAVMQWKSQVFFLQSQLEMAKATMQMKDATIKALDFTVFQQRRLLANAIPEQHSENTTSVKKDDDEPLIGDAVHVTTYEGKGFRLNLPHVLRLLKRKFGIEKADRSGPRQLPPSPGE
jgi:hypothetical protein